MSLFFDNRLTHHPVLTPPFSGLLEFLVPFLEDLFFAAVQLVHWRNIPDRRVGPGSIIIFYKLKNNSFHILEGQRCFRPYAFRLEHPVPLFFLPVAPEDKTARSGQAHPALPDECLEIPGDERRPIIRNDPGSRIRVFLPGPLKNQFHIQGSHRFSNLPMKNIPAVPVQDAAQVVKGPADVQKGNVDMPMLMNRFGANESLPLQSIVLIPRAQ